LLVRKTVTRLNHPTEPGAWIEVRLPLSAGDMELMRDGTRVGMVTIDLLAAVITGWSDPSPVSVEAVRDLDLDTFMWLATEVQARSGIREEAEKKDSNASSSPVTDPEAAGSRASLGI